MDFLDDSFVPSSDDLAAFDRGGTVWSGPYHNWDLLQRTKESGTGAVPGHADTGDHYQSEDSMMQFWFRWFSLGRLTEVASLFPNDDGPTPGPDPSPPPPVLAGISRMRPGDKWDRDIGIAVAMVRFRDGGRYNTQERRMSESLRRAAAVRVPPNSWGDFRLTLSQLLLVLRVRTEFRIAMALEAQRKRTAFMWIEDMLAEPENEALDRALAAVREVGGIQEEPLTFPRFLFPVLNEGKMAEACAKTILRATGPLTAVPKK